MWFRSVASSCGQQSALRGSLLLMRWRTPATPRRWASSSSTSASSRSQHSSSSSSSHHNNFRAGVVDQTPYQVKPNFNIPLWQPPARFMKYRAVRWLSNNLLALATYQLALEVGFTIIFGSLLYADAITAQGVCDTLERWHYPFLSWMDLSDCTYTEPIHVGPFTLNPAKITALHTGHNLANGLLPVQVVLMLSTFSPMHRFYRSLRGLPVAAAVANTAAAPASGGGASMSSAASAGGAAGAAKTASGHRRASYARTSAKAAPPRQPF